MEPVYEYVYAVKTLGSFTAAAKYLNITQPALSIAIKKLEEKIDHPIFYRDTKPIALTPAGEILFSFIEKLILLESNTKAALADIANWREGTITIGATQYFTAFILPKYILSFADSHPKAQINIIERSADMLPDLLENNDINLIFSLEEFDLNRYSLYKGITDYVFISIPKSFINSTRLRKYCLTREEIISTKYEELKSIPSLDDFNRMPFVLLRPGNNLHYRSRMLFQLEGIMPPIKMMLDQLTTAHYISKAGFAATLTTDRLIKQIHDNDELLYVKFDHPLMIRNFNIIIKKDVYRPLVLQEFIEMFQ